MTVGLNGISDDAWTAAAEHLNTSGVFADEESRFRDALGPGSSLQTFESAVRARGYSGGSIHLERLEEERNGVSEIFFDSLKLPTSRAVEMAWDSAYQAQWHDRVEARVADWLKGLDKLRGTIESWLPPDYAIVERAPILMHEELMRRFEVPETQMASFDIRNAGVPVARVLPRALWTIGANGRIDLVGRHVSYMLVNRAKEFADADWYYHGAVNNLEAMPFDKPAFLKLLH